jgi:putative transposase
MARLARLAIAGEPHLLVQRAHGGQPVLRVDDDRRRYLECLREAAAHHGLLIHGYALLPDQVWMLATPRSDDALGRTLQALGRRFGADYNRRHGRTGALWEGRFRSTVLDATAYFLHCLRHVESAPLRMGLAEHPGAYAWSSAVHHLGLRRDPLVIEHAAYWAVGNTPFERQAAYQAWLSEVPSAAMVDRINSASIKGWPLGSADYVAKLTGRTQRRLIPLQAGRPTAKKTVPHK